MDVCVCYVCTTAEVLCRRLVWGGEILSTVCLLPCWDWEYKTAAVVGNFHSLDWPGTSIHRQVMNCIQIIHLCAQPSRYHCHKKPQLLALVGEKKSPKTVNTSTVRIYCANCSLNVATSNGFRSTENCPSSITTSSSSSSSRLVLYTRSTSHVVATVPRARPPRLS